MLKSEVQVCTVAVRWWEYLTLDPPPSCEAQSMLIVDNIGLYLAHASEQIRYCEVLSCPHDRLLHMTAIVADAVAFFRMASAHFAESQNFENDHLHRRKHWTYQLVNTFWLVLASSPPLRIQKMSSNAFPTQIPNSQSQDFSRGD